MAAMAAGDEAATFSFYREFRPELMASVRSAATGLGFRLVPDDVEALSVDVAIELSSRAGAWDPRRGALPWTWARLLIRSLVSSYVGQLCDALEADQVAERAEPFNPAPVDPPASDTLAALAAHDRVCALLQEALERVTTGRNIELVLRYAEQRRQGDPSPAHTVGQELGLHPPATRQVVHRVRNRLKELAEHDSRYAPLAGLPLLAAEPATAGAAA